MNKAIPRVRMFAGPNGSGKTTLYKMLQPEWFGVYINPDDILAQIQRTGFIDLSAFGISTNLVELQRYFRESTFLQKQGMSALSDFLGADGSRIIFSGESANGYTISVLSDFIRRQALREKVSFTFETVTSAPVSS